MSPRLIVPLFSIVALLAVPASAQSRITAPGGTPNAVTSVTGTANQILSSGGSTPVLSLSPVLVTPGTLTVGGNFTLPLTAARGAGKAIAGKATAFRVTVGAGGDTTGVVAFTATFANAPVCVANNETTGNLARTVTTTTSVTVNAVMVAGDAVTVQCQGY